MSLATVTRLVLLSAVSGIAAVLPNPARAQQPAAPATGPAMPEAAPEADAVERIIRTYDLSDLTRPTHNYPAGYGADPAMVPGGMGGGASGGSGPGMPAGAGGGSEQVMAAESITELMMELVAPESWKVNGGVIGSISLVPRSGLLIVAQTPDNHRQIAEILDQLRAQQGMQTMVSTRVYWVFLEPAEVRAMFDAAKQKPDARDGPRPGPQISMPVVSDAAMERAVLYCQGQNTCFNGQTVGITSDRQWSTVTDVSPVVGTNAVGYDPTMTRAGSGVTLQVTPQLVPNSDSVILDLRSNITEMVAPGGPIDLSRLPAGSGEGATPAAADPAAPLPGGDRASAAPAAAAQGMIDRQDVVRQSFATTLRVPLGRRVLVGGMTLEPASGATPRRQLYIVVEVDAVK